MYFPYGGATCAGVSKPGEIVWSRIYVQNDRLHMDVGRGKVVKLPEAETQKRLNATTPVWPITHGVTYGVSRDQMMARHKANHIQIAYAKSSNAANRCLAAKSEMAQSLGSKFTFVEHKIVWFRFFVQETLRVLIQECDTT